MNREHDDLSSGELLEWLEFSCWTALALMPLLYFVNGPSVSVDQSVVRTALLIAAAVGAISLRIYHLSTKSQTNKHTQGTPGPEGARER